MIKKFNESNQDNDIGVLTDIFQQLEYEFTLDISVKLDLNNMLVGVPPNYNMSPFYTIGIQNIYFNLRLANEICSCIDRSLNYGFDFSFIKTPFSRKTLISSVVYRPRLQYIYITEKDSFKSGKSLIQDIGFQMVLTKSIDSIYIFLEKNLY